MFSLFFAGISVANQLLPVRYDRHTGSHIHGRVRAIVACEWMARLLRYTAGVRSGICSVNYHCGKEQEMFGFQRDSFFVTLNSVHILSWYPAQNGLVDCARDGDHCHGSRRRILLQSQGNGRYPALAAVMLTNTLLLIGCMVTFQQSIFEKREYKPEIVF